ncbi:probable F420-dependent oxidoreductase, MSMEG_4141 family [Streptomyces sp. Ag82_O1-12]|uniref:LLM class F420-dependent oxidoreductase n=1 Tax=unclassified Streptomyces TaxID=2593676 RepID=UPI000BD87329|nr:MULTISPECIES: LLM class F420-dependent oxidoreductase [unclassified Streptomyces]SMQ16562.1 probable F420-dependent oxidoreductase, MSMEG_4141 family [Streptomyces sp. Ag82_O1-12]SOD45590.1 probable F420-dependent oxidoreductase, MSMEG_4141 family [Streptomyces sp. Ag82_G6-1]
MTTPLKETVGRYGIWSVGLRSEDPDRRGELTEAAAELEELGYGAVWLGGNSSAANAAPLIEATSKLTVGTSIQSIWQHEPDAAATAFAELESAHPGRFLLGLGVSHAKRVEQYARPYSALVEHLDGLDAAGVPADRRLLAALGPKSLRLASDRAAGSIPYLVTPEHTAHAREILGEAPLLAPELGVVPETDPGRARALAREFLGIYLPLPNYTNNFLRHGFTEDDLSDGGSDRLVDALFAWGDDAAIRTKIDAFFEAGADHVALQVLTGEPRDALPRKAWRDLASALA